MIWALVNCGMSLLILVGLVLILYFRQKTIDNLIATDRLHGENLDLHRKRMDAIAARLEQLEPTPKDVH